MTDPTFKDALNQQARSRAAAAGSWEMTSDAGAYLRWLYETADRIREEAGRDAAKFESLLDDPALAQEALRQFPDRPMLYSLLQESLYFERLMVRRGFFVHLDGHPTPAALRRRNKEYAAEEKRRHEKAKTKDGNSQ